DQREHHVTSGRRPPPSILNHSREALDSEPVDNDQPNHTKVGNGVRQGNPLANSIVCDVEAGGVLEKYRVREVQTCDVRAVRKYNNVMRAHTLARGAREPGILHLARGKHTTAARRNKAAPSGLK